MKTVVLLCKRNIEMGGWGRPKEAPRRFRALRLLKAAEVLNGDVEDSVPSHPNNLARLKQIQAAQWRTR